MIKLKVDELAEKLNKNASEMARETGVNRNTIQALLGGRVAGIRFDTLEKLCYAYNLSISDVLEYDTGQDIDVKSVTEKPYRQEAAAVPMTCFPWIMGVGRPGVLKDTKSSITFGRFHTYFKDGYLQAYWDEGSLNKLAREVYKHFGRDRSKLEVLYDEFLISAAVLESIYKKQFDVQASNLDSEEILKLFEFLNRAYDTYWEGSVFIDSFDVGFDQEMIDVIAKKYSFTTDEIEKLTTPSEKTFADERLLVLLRLVDMVKKKKWAKKDRIVMITKFVKENYAAQKYKRDYDYYRSNYAVVKHFTDEEIAEEIERYLLDSDLFKQEKERLENYERNRRAEIQEILKRHRLSENPLWFFERLTIWREERKRYNLMGIHVFDQILYALEHHTGIPRKYLQYLAPNEVRNVLQGQVTQKVLKERRNKGVMMSVSGQDYSLLVGAEADSVRDELEAHLQKAGPTSVISGRTASQGYAKGTAKIILSEKDFGRFEKGDVLVTGMTRPEFVPLMKKAVGIVTNEGGITCHAAIVSRELNKPCVIGTKNATEIIKEGDVVEVRANHGTVRIVS